MADDAKPMSQEAIDALLNALGGDGSAPSRPAEAPVPAGPTPAVDQAELDLLIAALEEKPPEPAAPATPAAPSGPLGQNDIDALIQGLAGGAPAPAPAAPATDGPLGQDDIDAMLANLSAGGPPPAPTPAPAAPAQADGALGQSDIDALIAGLSGEAPAAAAPAPAAAPPSGPLGQDDIDAMLASLGGGTPAAPAAAAPAPAPAPSGQLGQDDIDAMLASLGGGAPAAPAPTPAPAAPAPPPSGQLGQDDIDAMLASLGGGAPAAPAPAPAAPTPAPDAQLGQTDIDALVNSMQPAALGEQPTVVATPSPAAAANEPGLSSDVVDALVAKHAASPDEGGEGMIAQSDIDALVKSLGGTAPEAPAAAAPPISMTEQLARHDDAIDQLLAGGAAAGGAAMGTMDAIDVRAELGKGSGPQTGPTVVRATSIPALPVDLRGARWMLMAAVLLLSICCGTLVVVAGAVRSLAAELKAERTANLAPTDNYGDDFKAALLRLHSPQDEEVAKGVLFLQRLKKLHPSHETELGLELARHFRSRASWREARREYAAIVEESSTLQDDPRVHLEYAEVLARVKERALAVRQVNLLLANEAVFIGETNLAHLPRPAPEIATNRATLQEAQLFLGRLLAEDDGRRTIAAISRGGHGDHGDSHASPSHAAHEAASEGHAAHGEAH